MIGLGLVVVGLIATAWVLLLTPASRSGIAAAATLLVAGIGSGWVVSPNITMTLECVPVRMAGSAGGALQTGQRIGSAIGTAALGAVYYGVLRRRRDGSFPWRWRWRSPRPRSPCWWRLAIATPGSCGRLPACGGQRVA